MNSRKLPQIVVRMPTDVKEWINAQAEKNYGSQNSEIVRCIREKMERITPDLSSSPKA